MLKFKFSQRWWPWAALAAIVVIVFVVKLAVLNKYPTPPSVDAGNHLSILNAFHGHDVTGYDLKYRYPPLYFLLVLDPLTKLFPVFSALKISASLVSSIIAIPFFLLARKITGSNVVALFTAGLYAFNEGHSSMMCWGAIPNLLGIFFMLWSAYYIVDAVERNSRISAILAGFFLSLIVGTHHLTAPYYAIALMLSALLLIVIQKKTAVYAIKILVLVVVSGVILSLPYLPTYISIASNTSVFTEPEAIPIMEIDVNMVTTVLGAVFKSSTHLWVILTTVGFFGLWKGPGDRFIKVFISSLVLSCPILAVVLGSVFRPFYFIYTPVLLAFSAFISGFWWERLVKAIARAKLLHAAILIAFLTIISSSLVVGSYNKLVEATDYYQVANEDVVEGLDWLKENSEPNAIIITNVKELAWWIEGYALRKSFMPSVKPVLAYKDEWQEIDTANKIVAGNYVVENGYIRVGDFFPAGFDNPKIAVRLGQRYQDLIHFNDTSIALYSELKTAQHNITESEANMIYTYSNDQVMINRTVRVTQASEVIVNYNYNLINYSAYDFELNQTVGILPSVKTVDYSINDNIIRLTLEEHWGQTINAEITVLETDCELKNVYFTPKGENVTSPFFSFSFNITDPNFYMKFLVSVEPKVQPRDNSIEFFVAYELLKQHNIEYIILNTEGSLSKDKHRFAYDPQYFKPVFENARVTILQVTS